MSKNKNPNIYWCQMEAIVYVSIEPTSFHMPRFLLISLRKLSSKIEGISTECKNIRHNLRFEPDGWQTPTVDLQQPKAFHSCHWIVLLWRPQRGPIVWNAILKFTRGVLSLQLQLFRARFTNASRSVDYIQFEIEACLISFKSRIFYF